MPPEQNQKQELGQEDYHRRFRREQRRTRDLEQHCQTLMIQLRGGRRDVDPATCTTHPGHVLIKLGWEFVPDDPDEPEDDHEDSHLLLGCFWRDPQEKRTGKHSLMPISMALSIACRRLLGWPDGKVGRPPSKSRAERLLEDD